MLCLHSTENMREGRYERRGTHRRDREKRTEEITETAHLSKSLARFEYVEVRSKEVSKTIYWDQQSPRVWE